MEIKDIELLKKNPRWYGFLGLLIGVNYTGDYEPEYEGMVKALSIRSRRKRLEYIYDYACDKIDNYNVEKGLMCHFENGRCGDKNKPGRINGCCYHCRYQNSTGCPTRNLTCKFYFCDKMHKLENKPLTFKDMPEFSILSLRQQYIIQNNPYCKNIFCSILIMFE